MNSTALFVFFLISWASADVQKRVEICDDVGERIRGSALLDEYRGKRVVLAFSELHCPTCASRLLRLSEVARHFSIDVVVIVPPNESPVDVKRGARRYPALSFESAPCAPCEFDYVLGTTTSKIFVLDSCGRLLHRFHQSATKFAQLKSSFPTHSCGPPCSSTERRKRDPDSTLPPVGCGPRKQIAAIVVPESAYDTRLQMLPDSSQSAAYTLQESTPASRNQQYKQIFQSPARQTQRTPQPVVSVSYPGRQAPYQQSRAQPAEPVYPQTHSTAAYNRPRTRVQGRYQKYEPDGPTDSRWQNTPRYGPPTTTQSTREPNDRVAEQRRQVAREREEYAKQMRERNEQSAAQPTTQIESPLEAEAEQVSPISFTQSFQSQRPRPEPGPAQRRPNSSSTPPTASTTRRPPKSTKQPLVYSNVARQGSWQYERRTHGNQPYESTYQQQQRRRNELAAQRQRAIQEKQRMELEQLQRQELQRQIAQQAARQAAAAAAAIQKADASKVEAAPLYHDDAEESVDTTDYYEDIDEWTTAIPQIRLESPVTAEPLPENPAKHPEFLFDLPCNGYTDELCYQQQNQPKDVHDCCRTRIVLTDQCVPGRCSNVTHQLCCIQKLLQSKFKCCNDKKQGEVLFAGDSFSQCCHAGFVVDDDPCCPKAYSQEHWRSIYELCLPAVSVDLSQVRVPQKVGAGLSTTVSFDFSKTDKWRFDCKYGGHIPQYGFGLS